MRWSYQRTTPRICTFSFYATTYIPVYVFSPTTFSTSTIGFMPITNPATSLTNSCSSPIYPPGPVFQRSENASPMPFSGRREDRETFIHSCILYINGRPSEFGTEQNKVTWILSHMQTGSARAWREYVMTQIFKKALWYHTADELLQEIQH